MFLNTEKRELKKVMKNNIYRSHGGESERR